MSRRTFHSSKPVWVCGLKSNLKKIILFGPDICHFLRKSLLASDHGALTVIFYFEVGKKKFHVGSISNLKGFSIVREHFFCVLTGLDFVQKNRRPNSHVCTSLMHIV
jgi:hypothetical protein